MKCNRKYEVSTNREQNSYVRTSYVLSLWEIEHVQYGTVVSVRNPQNEGQNIIYRSRSSPNRIVRFLADFWRKIRFLYQFCRSFELVLQLAKTIFRTRAYLTIRTLKKSRALRVKPRAAQARSSHRHRSPAKINALFCSQQQPTANSNSGAHQTPEHKDFFVSTMGVYSRIFAATSSRWTSAASSAGRKFPPQALWALPGFVGFSWFIWGALSVEIKQSVGLYWDPDAIINKVEADRAKRMEEREALKAASKPAAAEPDEEEEEEEEEEVVTAKDIEDAVQSAVNMAAAVSTEVEVELDSTNDDDDDEEEDKGEEEEEEEEEEKPKKPKVDFNSLSSEEKWEYFSDKAINPGDDDVSYR